MGDHGKYRIISVNADKSTAGESGTDAPVVGVRVPGDASRESRTAGSPVQLPSAPDKSVTKPATDDEDSLDVPPMPFMQKGIIAALVLFLVGFILYYIIVFVH